MQRILAAPKLGLWIPIVLVIVAGSCPGLVAQGLTAVELEDDFLVATRELEQQCVHRCPDQNRTGFNEHIDVSCGSDCYITQCAVGCSLWEQALESSCQNVCNKTDQELLEPKELYCMMGCNDALNRYFKWLKIEIGTPPAPALVADSLTATSLSLEWEVPERLVQLSRHKSHGPRSYLVQWRYEEVAGDWKFCRNQSMGDNSTIRVDNLQPYTKYRFRVALLLSPRHDEVLISEQSVIILTLAQGPPMSEPKIVRAVAVDHSRISISWEPGPFPNGPVLSYVLQIKDLDPIGYSALKDIPESNSSRYYIFEKLYPERNYSVSVTMRNPEGEGPPSVSYVQTPSQPLDLEEDIQPTLILGAERSVLSQGSDLLSDPLTELYRSQSQKIRGTAIHIRRNLIFVSDDIGYVFKSPFRQGSEKGRIAILSPDADHNFRPTLLSVDWLNDHLYILGQTKITGLWQISRCDFSGERLTVAIAGLQRQPEHFEVDPFNGYLFWVIGSRSADAGLFRLDLGDISNGVKHEIKPLQLNNRHNLGAFSIDHTSFRVLVPDQDANTVLAISLDGKTTENIRNNTQRPRFEKVKSLALANGLFYWTNGKEVFAEDYHKKQNSYYHNAFPIALNNSYFSICVNLSSAQPIPIPVNPPRNVQALLTSTKIKIFWSVPHLLGIKGKGAWQEWMYKLELVEGKSGRTLEFPQIDGTTFSSVDGELLRPGQEYVIKAAAYTDAGRGPWSTEFHARTLKDAHERHLVWSSSEGVMRSDVIGDSVETLIGKAELEEGVVTDLAWFESILYVVSNSTLMFYNQSEGQISKLRELESVECVTIDWIGRRLYFYNPSQQMIMRSSLHGEQHEPIHNVKNVREIKFDALRGYIYYTSEFAMEAFRLNGKDKHSYYLENDRFTGKGVIGLTLDMSSGRVYWIVRSISYSELFSAHMAGTGSGIDSSLMTVLSEQSPRGPLTHFSDRLLWLQHDEVVVGDLQGGNLAHIKNPKLNGTRAFTIIDPAHHIYPDDNRNVNVLPTQVNDSSIRIQGTWKKFSIVWDPVTNVNFGKVYYKLTIRVKGKKDDIYELSKPSHWYNSSGANLLPPHTEINVTVSAFTYWRSSAFSTARLFSPSGKPSQPTRPRVFVQHFKDPILDTHAVEATFRWSPPKTPNGPIIGYRVHCWYEEDGITTHVLQGELTNETERVVPHLVHNVSYSFRVQAQTKAREGDLTAVQSINTAEDHPIPQALVATGEHIVRVDFDLGETYQVVGTSTPVSFMVRLARERKLFWVDENNELFQYDGTVKSKLHTISGGPVLALGLDWIQRILYWSQQELVGSAIYAFDLNRLASLEGLHLERIVYSGGEMSNLVVSPFDRRLFWTEKVPDDVIYVHSLEDNRTEEFFDDSFEECPNRTAGITVHPMLTLQTGVSEEARLFWAETGLRSVGLSSRTCINFGFEYYPKMKSITKDSDHFYWLEDDEAIVRMDDGGAVKSKTIPGARTLVPLQLQYYPERRCLIPLQEDQDYQARLLQRTEDSLTLLMPRAEVYPNCSAEPSGIQYLIYYAQLEEMQANGTVDCDLVVCSKVSSYDRSKTIRGLRPFTKYRVQVALVNYYQEQIGMLSEQDAPKLGTVVVFSTAAGAPSKPENISALTISPTEAVVHWSPPLVKNSDRVWYEIHWQTENVYDGSKNRQQQLVIDLNEDLDSLSMNLTKLQPSLAYTIWIRAYSTESTFSESDQVNIVTFPEPEDIRLVFNSSTELGVHWRPHVNISKYKLQYAAVGSKTWETVFDTGLDATSPERDIFKAIALQPKTQYRFIVLLFYPNRNDPYVWPPDARFVYETDADRPSAPGRPVVTQIRQDVYKVSWEPSKDNGATILEYALEALVRSPRNTNRVERAAIPLSSSEEADDDSFEDMNNTIPTRVDVSSTNSQEYITFDERWDLVYNGTDVYWIIPEKQSIHKHTFRVRARNGCGWGPFSGESKPISQPLLSSQTENYLIILVVSVSAIFLLFLVLIFVCACRRAEIEKKIFIDATTTRIPDVELANLRELPRRGNFIHSNNILYSSGPLTDSEIALLPQIRREQISMTSSPFLGSGAFGEVYEGIVKGVGGEVETRVAIKTLRKGATEQEKAEFLQEAHLMSNFKHKHILKLIGVCLDHDSLYIIMELMQGGDLLSYLRSNRPTPGTPSSLTLLDLITMCVDVATGCRYLEEMHFVHRDLACRNCLVSSTDPRERVVKIGDFGLARDIYKNDYYRKEGEGLLPVRWMSPESLVDGVFTSQSDIWAFGVLLWEIMTLGQQPYPARNNVEVLHYVRDGGRLGRPQDCPEELYQLMLKCWSYSPEDRPTFRYLLEVLKSLKERTSDSIQITSQFPCKVQNDIKFGSGSGTGTGSGGAFIITPPTSSSSSGATLITTTIPKYLELVYDDSNSNTSRYSTGEDVPLTAGLPAAANQVMPTDNGYEIPINDILLRQQHPGASCNNKGRTFSSSSTVSNVSTLPVVVVAEAVATGSGLLRVDDCSSLEALLPINSILTVKLPEEEEEDQGAEGDEQPGDTDYSNTQMRSSSQQFDTNEDSITGHDVRG
ncbi:proto-oncogene tyrosine-protein kinase ROS isoform X2 [Toxorhynchites rutilus septentrionalis]|uniref:proto-oncogene tyrosine-protein kinase ROS isoform X2 n=1 Tax=Toxorhynchites rutilus septentrionalis TaxID=329112 RepID=UPI00247A8CB5|nr:proto-oncogene tyrosine-protein kinase ROS isoform X2 [Toxorhynchites rutilus septentrionalis]